VAEVQHCVVEGTMVVVVLVGVVLVVRVVVLVVAVVVATASSSAAHRLALPPPSTHSPSVLHSPADPLCKFKASYKTNDPLEELGLV